MTACGRKAELEMTACGKKACAGRQLQEGGRREEKNGGGQGRRGAFIARSENVSRHINRDRSLNWKRKIALEMY